VIDKLDTTLSPVLLNGFFEGCTVSVDWIGIYMGFNIKPVWFL